MKAGKQAGKKAGKQAGKKAGKQARRQKIGVRGRTVKNKQIAFITQTAVMLALLVCVQSITRSFGQFATGSLVNLILLVSVFMIGLGGGLAVAVASPFLAFFAGIGPAFIQVVPFVAAGNAIFVAVAHLSAKRVAKRSLRDVLLAASGLAAAGAAKTAFLWVGLVLAALPLIPGINENQAAAITAAFTWPQLVTALIGGALAMMVVPILKIVRKS